MFKTHASVKVSLSAPILCAAASNSLSVRRFVDLDDSWTKLDSRMLAKAKR